MPKAKPDENIPVKNKPDFTIKSEHIKPITILTKVKLKNKVNGNSGFKLRFVVDQISGDRHGAVVEQAARKRHRRAHRPPGGRSGT